MGGRRSPKLQLQFLHLPYSCCLQETEFGGMRLSYPTKKGDTFPRLERGIVHINIVVSGVSLGFSAFGVKKALEPPYDGPFPEAKRYDKYFTVKIKGKDINISVDRLKPEYLFPTDGDNHDNLKQLEHTPTLPEKKTDCAKKN
ncbi:hypothetical protein TNCV_4931381 [Trichonephila clavipes]|nr:hypothetical protein TNCV_4931381 [Trichonephila clavipes]